jgi:hypothetical protein
MKNGTSGTMLPPHGSPIRNYHKDEDARVTLVLPSDFPLTFPITGDALLHRSHSTMKIRIEKIIEHDC